MKSRKAIFLVMGPLWELVPTWQELEERVPLLEMGSLLTAEGME
jgi:hypothetical protein